MNRQYYGPTPPREKVVPHDLEEGDKVSCDVCRTEIPASVAVRAEGQDYVRHFCGLSCYRKWAAQANHPVDEPTPPAP